MTNYYEAWQEAMRANEELTRGAAALILAAGGDVFVPLTIQREDIEITWQDELDGTRYRAGLRKGRR